MNKLDHLTIGDFIRTPHRDSRYGYRRLPVISNEILEIIAQTATQFTAKSRGRVTEVRVRKSDGKLIGKDFEYAEPATAEQIAENESQIAAHNRYVRAYSEAQKIWDKPLHQLDLTTAQLERLAKAWAEVQAMTAQPSTN